MFHIQLESSSLIKPLVAFFTATGQMSIYPPNLPIEWNEKGTAN